MTCSGALPKDNVTPEVLTGTQPAAMAADAAAAAPPAVLVEQCSEAADGQVEGGSALVSVTVTLKGHGTAEGSRPKGKEHVPGGKRTPLEAALERVLRRQAGVRASSSARKGTAATVKRSMWRQKNIS